MPKGSNSVAKRDRNRQRVKDYFTANPTAYRRDAAAALGIGVGYVGRHAKALGIPTKMGLHNRRKLCVNPSSPQT